MLKTPAMTLGFSSFFVFFYLPTVGTCTQSMFVAWELTICQKVLEIEILPVHKKDFYVLAPAQRLVEKGFMCILKAKCASDT